MKNASLFFPILGILCLLTIVGCADHPTPSNHPAATPSKFGYGGTNSDASFVESDAAATSTNAVSATDAGTTDASATNAPANPFPAATPQPVAAARDLPYGTPVPGKPGFVTSPHSPTAGYVDVRGFPPGTEVKDPYSGKIFLVP